MDNQEADKTFVYTPPKRRGVVLSAPTEHQNMEFMRKVTRSQFRRSEYSLQKLERRLEKISGLERDSEEETETPVEPLNEEDTGKDSEQSGKSADELSPNKDNDASPPPSPTPYKSGHRFSFTVRNLHSRTMDRRLSLIENVQKNYGKYIRPPEEMNSRPLTSPVMQSASTSTHHNGSRLYSPALSRFDGELNSDIGSNLVSRNSTPCSKSSVEGVERETSRGNLLSLDAIPMAHHHSRSGSSTSIRSGENVFLIGSPVNREGSHNELPRIIDANGKTIPSQRRATIAGSTTQTNDRWKKLADAIHSKRFEKKCRTVERQDTASKIREIHKQMGLNKRKKLRSSKSCSSFRGLKRNDKFQKEMIIIMETLQAINLRLDEQLKLLNGGATNTNRRQSKSLKLPNIHVKG